MRSAQQVLTISQRTAEDAIEHLRIPEERITVIGSGVSDRFSSLVRTREEANGLLRSALPKVRPGFLLYVGGVDYRKNLEGAIRGYARLPAAMRDAHQLVIACNLPLHRRISLRTFALDLGIESRNLVLTGFVPDRELAALYRACELFIFPSLYEGAGLPILEAMTCGAPVAASGTSAIPELLGDPAATFDPADPADIARCVREVLDSPAMLEALRKSSKEQAALHTWERVARRTIEGYERALEFSDRWSCRLYDHGADHRGQRAGRLLSRRAPAREGLRGPRPRPRVHRRALRAARPVIDRITLHPGDLLDENSLVGVLRRSSPDEVYNLAAMSSVAESWRLAVATAEYTAVGVTRLLEGIRGVCPEARFYQASSSEMFGRAREAPQSEATPFYPRSPYGVAKAYGHFITVNYRESFGLHASSGILFNHESPAARPVVRHPADQPRGWPRSSSGWPMSCVLGNLDVRRDWGYAKEYVEAMWLMLQQDRSRTTTSSARASPTRSGTSSKSPSPASA